MGRKTHPTAFRLGTIKNWKSRWFNPKQQRSFLEEDWRLREFIERSLPRAGIESIVISRSGASISIVIHTARPGIVIGRGGKGLEELREGIRRLLQAIARERSEDFVSTIKLDIEEIRGPEGHAKLVAKNVAEQLERRFPFRRVMKQTIDKVMQQKEVQGIKLSLAGRLGGAEIARVEHLSAGTIPLSTLRADIDYAHIDARTTYGTIGVKVWLYRGERFESELGEKEQ
jgi:small subunit ribosomal protein S3